MNLKDKNILFLCSWYPNRVLPTAGNFIQKHARCLIEEANIFVLAVNEDIEMNTSFEQEEGSIDGVPHLIIHYKSPKRILRYFYKFFAYLRGFKQVRKRMKNIDLVHVNVFFDAGVFLWLISFFKKYPFVVTEHSTLYLKHNWKKVSRIKKWVIKKVANQSKYILPVSKNLMKNLESYNFKGPYVVIPNIVDTKLFSLKQDLNGKFRFLHISNFHLEKKNMKGIMKCIKKLSDIRHDFQFTLAGDGDMEPLKQFAKDLKIEERYISIRGKMSEEEVSKVMKEHDAFVLFSNSENLPVVLLEAQSCGLPIITSKIGGTAEIVSDKRFGEIIAPIDEPALVQKMDEMIDNYEKYDSDLIRQKATNLYSEEKIKSQLLEVYKKVLFSS